MTTSICGDKSNDNETNISTVDFGLTPDSCASTSSDTSLAKLCDTKDNVWVIDMECYQDENILYPLEIALYNTKQKEWHMYYIKWPFVFYYTRAFHYQFKRHGLDWGDGDTTLRKAFKEIHDLVKDGGLVFVKGLEKYKLVKDWLSGIDVQELNNEPSIKTLSSRYPDSFSKTACAVHLENGSTCCARHKAFLVSNMAQVELMDIMRRLLC